MSDEPTREQLVLHLIACIEQEGNTIEAADAPGHSRPRPVKLVGPGRLRPDVVALDGRRRILGKAVTAAEVEDRRLPRRLETLARDCRMLVICMPESAAADALGTVFGAGSTLSRAKMRLLLHPRLKWEELPKAPLRPR
jgi:hypothetical protein